MSTVALLEIEPDLAGELDPVQRTRAAHAARVQTNWLEEGRWTPLASGKGAAEILGLLMLEGLLVRRLRVADRQSAELFGAGDLMRPWPPDAYSDETRGSTPSWTVLQRARVAVLDRDFQRAVAAWPEVMAAVVARSSESSWQLGARLAIVQEPKLVLRLLLLLEQIGERWGRVVSNGLWIPFRLSHDILADLACAQRPSVSVAVRELAERGLAVRRGDGGWLLPRLAHASETPEGAPRRAPAQLSDERRQLYRSLVETVASSPGTLVEAGEAERVAVDLADRYAAGPRSLRRRIDGALDAVEAGLESGSFAAIDVRERLEHLRRRLHEDAPLVEAVALAAAPFDPRGFHWSVRSVELWIKTVSAGGALASSGNAAP